LGQKVNPVGLRLGHIKKWQSVWFANKKYSEMLHEDLQIRKYLKKNCIMQEFPKLRLKERLIRPR